MKEDRLKGTRTTWYLLGTSESQGFDGTREYSAALWLPGHDPRNRLGWGVTPKHSYNPVELAHSIASDPRNPYVFADTSLFDERTPLHFWRVLLDGPVRVTLVPSVRKELEPWLGSHREHPVAQAILLGDTAVEVQGYEAAADERFTFEYYVSLLAMRKKVLRVSASVFEEKYGRTPSDAEVRAIRAEYHRVLGPRGYLLARKGEESSASAFSTDERLVYAAVSAGLRSGRPIYLLTKDEDFQEQFYKLLWLIDTQYRGMLLARAFSADPARFRTWELRMDEETFAHAFEPGDNIALEMAPETYDELLPRLYTPVEMTCYVLGTGLTAMTFDAEREMEELLRIKASTEGLNTDLLGGRNCHISLDALPPPRKLPPFRRCAAVAFDRRTKLSASSAVVSVVDARNAVETVERFIRRVPKTG